MSIPPIWLKFGALALIGLGLAVAAGVTFYATNSLPRRLWDRYTTYLDRDFKALFMKHEGAHVARLQLVGMTVFFLLLLFLNQPLFLFAILI